MRTEIEETLYLRVAFGAAIGGNRLRKEEANESLVAWEAATRPCPVSPHINEANGLLCSSGC